ncbi:MAG: glycosyltransferase family 25 protein [Rhodobacteraceae bacterium]|nr:glycosyltransferase family 25 protein [Paracoccaceae bacterium]
MKTFVIHLARATTRQPQADRLLAQAPFPAEILDAVDGHMLSERDRHRFQSGLYAPPYPFRLTDGEIGVFLSHRTAWARIVEEHLPCALILEDDVALAPGFEGGGSRLCGRTYRHARLHPVSDPPPARCRPRCGAGR